MGIVKNISHGQRVSSLAERAYLELFLNPPLNGQRRVEQFPAVIQGLSRMRGE